MDNNLISIDKLFSQRLEGGEEKERSGAWLQMKDLLDNEMPKNRPLGFFYWRRALSYMGILLLLATLTVGGYEISSSIRSIGGHTAMVNNNASPNIAAFASTKNDYSTKSPNNNNSVNSSVPKNNTISSAHQDNSGSQKSIVAVTVSKNNILANKNTATDSRNSTNGSIANTTEHIYRNSNKVGSKTTPDANTAATTAVAHHHLKKANINSKIAATTNINNNVVDNITNNAGKDNINVSTATSNAKDESEKGIAASGKPNTNSSLTTRHKRHHTGLNKGITYSNSDNGAINNSTVASNNTNNNSAMGTVVAANINHKHQETRRTEKTDNSNSKHNLNNTTAKNNTKINKSGNITPTDMNTIALAGSAKNTVNTSGLSKTATTATSNLKSGNGNNVDVVSSRTHQKNNMPLNTAHAATNINAPTVQTAINNATSNGDKKVTATKQSAKGRSFTGKSKGAASKVANTHENKGQRKTGVAINDDNKNNADNDEAGIASTDNVDTKVNKVKMIRLEKHYVKQSINYGSYRLDTVSVEEVQLPNHYKNIFAAASRKVSSKEGSENENAENENVVAQINPNATTLVLAKPYTEKQKVNSDYKKVETGNVIQSIGKMFNDIKYNISGVHFAAGLTAGINATFFGPSSMKGFQFGFQGNIIFNDTWSVLTQFKYFHRMNNNYTIADNYNRYNSLPGGLYQKDSVTQSIGFSTLHSFELPIAIQYAKAHVIFSAGLNLAYNIGVNIDEAPIQTTPTKNFVNTIGSDQNPKIKVGDFKSKFGLGYIIGMSFKVAPDVTLDLRSVQTFWDNSKTTGAKMVSSQLYKNPSIQLSIGYTFGSKKDDSKKD